MSIPTWEAVKFEEQRKQWGAKYPYKPRKTQKECIGIDTETTEHGDIFLICDSFGRSLEFPSPQELMEFLTYTGYREAHCGFWNVKFDNDVIFKMFGVRAMQELNKYGQAYYDRDTLIKSI